MESKFKNEPTEDIEPFEYCGLHDIAINEDYPCEECVRDKAEDFIVDCYRDEQTS